MKPQRPLDIFYLQPKRFAPSLLPPTVSHLDEYCEKYKFLFPKDEDFAAFKALHLGITSKLKRKYILDITKEIRPTNYKSFYKSLLRFLDGEAWQIEKLRKQRLALTLQILKEQSITLVIEERGIPKKGENTDYMTRQYMSNLRAKKKGIIVLVGYGVINGIVFPLAFQVFKPEDQLKSTDRFKSKTQLAVEMVEYLINAGFKVSTVLMDGFQGEDQTSSLHTVENNLCLDYVFTVSYTNRDWLTRRQVDWETCWMKVELNDSSLDFSLDFLFVQEGVLRRQVSRCWRVSNNNTGNSVEGRWSLITNVSAINYQKVIDYYLLREWIECFINRISDELGWMDFQMKRSAQYEQWWEISMSAHLLIIFDSGNLERSIQSDTSRL